MALVICNEGKLALLNAKKSYLNTLYLALYQNNHTPVAGDDVTAYTECSFNGYVRQPLTAWGNPFLNAAGKAESDEVVHTFTALDGSVANQVFGYMVLDVNGRLVWAELNPAGPFL